MKRLIYHSLMSSSKSVAIRIKSLSMGSGCTLILSLQPIQMKRFRLKPSNYKLLTMGTLMDRRKQVMQSHIQSSSEDYLKNLKTNNTKKHLGISEPVFLHKITLNDL